MSSKFNVVPFSDRSFDLGEGPHWNQEDRKLYFVDIVAGLVATIDVDGNFSKLFQSTNDFVSVVFPVVVDNDDNNGDDGKKIIFSTATKLFQLNLDNNNKEQTLVAEIQKQNVRFNDGKCDPWGRVWIGTMGVETKPAVLEPEQGSLYRLKGNRLEEQIDKISLSNGMCWSLDSKRMFFIDSLVRSVFVFDYDLKTGNVADKKVFLNMNDDDEHFSKGELPDGMTIDIKGNLWIAMFRGGRVVNIDGQNAKFIQSIELPTSLITSVCWGGENFDQMFVTSSRKFLNDEDKQQQPLAGYIFKVTSDDEHFKGYANFPANLSKSQ